jgi:adenine-specific DNA-methyltransferase
LPRRYFTDGQGARCDPGDQDRNRQAEDHLIFSAITDDGHALDAEVAGRLMTLPCASDPCLHTAGATAPGVLDTLTHGRQVAIQRVISERNARLFETEADKLDGWADDLKMGLEREIKEIDRQTKEPRRAATTALTLEEKLAGQKQIKSLEAQRNQKRRSLFDAQDQVDKQREELIAVIEGKLNQATSMQPLLVLRWGLA